MPPTSLLLAMIVGLTLVLVGRRASASLPAAPAWLTGPLFPLLVGVARPKSGLLVGEFLALLGFQRERTREF